MDPNLTPGFYEIVTGAIFLVRPTQDGRRLYANRLTVTAQGITSEYDKGAVHLLAADDRLTRAQVLDLTRLCRRCLVCHRRLKTLDSIERGMGPVCGKYLPPG